MNALIDYEIFDFNGEVDIFQLPSGRYLVDPIHIEEFKKCHNIS